MNELASAHGPGVNYDVCYNYQHYCHRYYDRSTSQEKEARVRKKRHESGKSKARVRTKKARVRKKKARVRKKQTAIQENEKLELGKRPSAGDSESRIHKLGFRN